MQFLSRVELLSESALGLVSRSQGADAVKKLIVRREASPVEQGSLRSQGTDCPDVQAVLRDRNTFLQIFHRYRSNSLPSGLL